MRAAWGYWASCTAVPRKPAEEAPPPAMALQYPFKTLLTKPNVKPAGNGDMFTESRFPVAKQDKEDGFGDERQ